MLGGAIVFGHKNQNTEYKARRLSLPQGVFIDSVVAAEGRWAQAIYECCRSMCNKAEHSKILVVALCNVA